VGQIINLLIVFVSFAGIVFILWRRMPLLLEFPAGSEGNIRDLVSGRAKDLVSSQKIKLVASKNLDKTLSKARTIASKTEVQTGEWLERLRRKPEERKEEFSKSYWEQLRRKPRKK
jgi:hypothetical protein